MFLQILRKISLFTQMYTRIHSLNKYKCKSIKMPRWWWSKLMGASRTLHTWLTVIKAEYYVKSEKKIKFSDNIFTDWNEEDITITV